MEEAKAPPPFAALEAHSTHPLARAIVRHAATEGIIPEAAAEVQVLKGQRVDGHFDGEAFWLESHRYVVERGQDAPEIARQATALEAEGQTVIVVGNSRHDCGLISLADTVRP